MKALLALTLISSAFAKTLDERIYHGDLAAEGQFPYVTRLVLMKENGNMQMCSGSLISDRYVLSAAHCAEGTYSAEVYLGQYRDNIFFIPNDVLVYIVEADEITIHPNRTSDLYDYDISLFHLPESVPLSEYSNIATIALPPMSAVKTYNNKDATAVGWGEYDDTTPNPGGLRYGEVHIQRHKTCAAEVKKYLGDFLTDGEICIDRSTGHGVCHGDSGGPLVYTTSDGTLVVLGVASYILGVCSTDRSNVYSFVPYNLQWISDTTGIKI